MGQKIRERQAVWEVRKSGRQLSRNVLQAVRYCSRQSGPVQDAGRLEFERAVQHPDRC